MNIVNKLTLRMLKENKRRTLVTIIGVIISVAMVTAVTTLFTSFMNLLQKEAVADNGNWHVLYKNVTKEQLYEIKNDEETDTVFISRDVGYAELERGQNPSKPYLHVKEFDSTAFEQFSIELIEGRLPKTPNEVVISQQIIDDGGVPLEIGQTITLQVGDRYYKIDDDEGITNNSFSLVYNGDELAETIINTVEKEYKIVGIINAPNWEHSFSPAYMVLSSTHEAFIGANEQVNASVLVKKLNRSIFNHSNQLAENLGIEEVIFNDELLRYHGIVEGDNLNRTFISLVTIIIAIIVVGSVSLINNAFAISVTERSRYLGMLASVGATKRQKRNSVYFEGVMIGLISIPLGLIAGIGGIAITLSLLNGILQNVLNLRTELTVVVTPMSIILTIIISMLTIFISVFIPALRASRISAIDAIRQTKDIKLSRKKVKTSKLVRKIFGIEAEIGLKNLKRNKKRYNATIFSLVISIVLFLTISYFTNSLQKAAEMSNFNPEYDISVSFDQNFEQIDQDVIENIRSFEDVTDMNIIYYFGSIEGYVDKSKLSSSLKERSKDFPDMLEDGKYLYNIDVNVLEDEDLKSYVEQISVDFNPLINSDHPTAILFNKNHFYDMEKEKYVEEEAVNLDIGDKIALQYNDWVTEKRYQLADEVEIIAEETEQLPLGIYNSTNPGQFILIMSKSSIEKLVGDIDIETGTSEMYIKSSDPMKTVEDLENIGINKDSIYNVYESKKNDEQFLFVLGVFVYGFITLITLITVSNIFNTISTSIALRKREFGMLKSVGMTPKGFNKMIHYESIFYGIKSLLYGLPISVIVMFLIYKATEFSYEYEFYLPWKSIGIVIVAVFLIVGIVMLYSSSKVKKENIIDALKQENI
ncbi:ABC transporter permease [Pallidibacillus thermolactis]|uniref:ABC transporter permease n=1 Tax=Pallidibacillus thermolactis TaxID=251051 RepID=UPI002E23F657|nr:FtsX-like permease family protein [Pallidibacillus thermolactis]MED1672425.1 FtsX-like permease family protein [Pallidibacillus thermolactis subsp. kokeshiiformis]